MKPYPRYKPTGLPWLPSVPEHWEVKKIRSCFTERTTKVSDQDYPPLSVSKGGVVPQMDNVAKSDDGDNRKLVCSGDFVINSRSDRKGSSGLSSLDGSVLLVNLVLKPRQSGAGRFFHYLLKSDSFVEEFYRNGHGIVADLWTTRYSEMKSIYIPLPPREEQDRIVRYLDEKTAAIDELVRAKEREIELLRERKQTLVSAAVTGGEEAGQEGRERQAGRAPLGTQGTSGTPGLNVPAVSSVPIASSPSCPSRPASPAGWRVCRLKDIVRSNTDALGESTSPDFEIEYLDISSVGNGFLRENPTKYRFADAPSRARRVLHEGDTIVSTVRTYLKSVLYIDAELAHCIASTGFSVLTPRAEVEPRYLGFLLQSSRFVDAVMKNSIGISYPAINDTKLLSLPVELPPLPEQRRIVERLDATCSELDAAESSIRKQIALLQELRTRLVSDAVTGAVAIPS